MDRAKLAPISSSSLEASFGPEETETLVPCPTCRACATCAGARMVPAPAAAELRARGGQ